MDVVDIKRQGNRLIAERRYEEADETFRRLIQIAPLAPEGYIGLAKVLDVDDRIDEIIALIDPVVDRIDSALLLKTLATAYRMAVLRGQPVNVRRAIDLHERYLKQREDAVATYYLGELYEKHEDDVRALESYRKAWQLQSDYPDAYQAYRKVALRLGRTADVAEGERRWAEQEPTRRR